MTMLTPDEIQKISDIIINMTEEELDQVVQRVEEMAEMEKLISDSYEKNPMTFSSYEVLQ
jgi:hypothetical protein